MNYAELEFLTTFFTLNEVCELSEMINNHFNLQKINIDDLFDKINKTFYIQISNYHQHVKEFIKIYRSNSSNLVLKAYRKSISLIPIVIIKRKEENLFSLIKLNQRINEGLFDDDEVYNSPFDETEFDDSTILTDENFFKID
jgi:hypothetical protein